PREVLVGPHDQPGGVGPSRLASILTSCVAPAFTRSTALGIVPRSRPVRAGREGRGMYKQVLDPVSHSLGTSSIFAVLPLLSLFVLLGGARMKAQWASLISLAVAVVVAIAEDGAPAGGRREFRAFSTDRRVQVVIIAFCFGALLQALGGFGTPVAICWVMLVGLGFRPIKAGAVALGA